MKITAKNIILMIHNKPAQTFQFVTILSLNQVNAFINSGSDTFTTEQVNDLLDYLLTIGNIHEPGVIS